jgi:uncharacterized protein YcsI (UPF0317 family)
MAKMSDYAAWSPNDVRRMIRDGKWDRPTSGMCAGHVQGNLVALPKELAYDFLVFAQRNPKPCPILDVTEPGDPEPKLIAPGGNVATDIPRYRIWKNGECVGEPTDAGKFWRDDLVAFLVGCSFSFEGALVRSNIAVRHIDCDCNVPMYITNIQCRPAGRLKGPMVVSMRPIPAAQVSKAVLCTGCYPAVHGAPVHIGEPEAIGIKDIGKPDFGDAVPINPGEIPVFWACGVTPQAAIMATKPDFAITHAPGCMFVADPLDSDYAVF